MFIKWNNFLGIPIFFTLVIPQFPVLLSVLLVVYYQQQQHNKYLNVVVVGVVGRILPTTTTS